MIYVNYVDRSGILVDPVTNHVLSPQSPPVALERLAKRSTDPMRIIDQWTKYEFQARKGNGPSHRFRTGPARGSQRLNQSFATGPAGAQRQVR